MTRWILLILGGCAVAVAIAVFVDHYQAGEANVTAAPNAAGVPAPALAAPGVGTGPQENLFKVFADAPPVEPGQFSTNELQNVFPAFKHLPFDKAGFDEVMLPLSYSDPDHVGDANEALALDALISNDLDWSPGCYCARHAYFAFKRDANRMKMLQETYDPPLVAAVMQYWHATHAIGGKLIRTPQGYTGKLQIFSPDGQIEHTQSYDQPRSFWDLLGDMDVDAMTFLDAKPSQKLANYLHEPRCKPKSLIDLGSAAFMRERSADEFGTYEKILSEDPSFAVVRHWYANQKAWMDGDRQSRAIQDGIALSARVEPGSLQEFWAAGCSDKNLAAQFPAWVDRAAELASEDSPFVIDCRLRNGCYGSQTRDKIVDRGIRTAAKFPNSHSLLTSLAANTLDRSMSASLMAASLLDQYQTGTGSKADEQRDLAEYCAELSRDDVAMELLSEEGPNQPGSNLYLLLEDLADAGRWDEATKLYGLLEAKLDQDQRKWMAPYAAFSAAVLQKKDLLDQILAEQHDVLETENLADIFQSYSDAVGGKALNGDDYLGIGRQIDFGLIWNMLLVAQCDAAKGISQHHRFMTEMSFGYPMDRFIWIAQDDYQRRDPSNDAPAFYDYLGWLFGNDPWVAKAVADFHARGGTDKEIDVSALRTDLQQGLQNGPYRVELGTLDWNHVLTPWRVAACVHQLLNRKKVADATEIARMYRDYGNVCEHHDTVTLGSMMLQKIAESSN